MSEAEHRLTIFATTPGDHIGPLMAAYGDVADSYEDARARLKADILMLLEEIKHASRADHG